ncbi:MAG: LytTR family transcriptional regulator DNA-binding domain-containing protein [Huintestinicola sp.]
MYDNVLIQVGNDRKLFRNNDVLTIESDRHYTIITAKNGTVSRFHMGFSEILPLFKGFIEINRGLAVNMSCIDMIKSSVITMCDGKTYKIARGKKDDVSMLWDISAKTSRMTDIISISAKWANSFMLISDA